jgi:DNA ligase-4
MVQVIKDGFTPFSMFIQDKLDYKRYTEVMHKYCQPKLGTFISTMECLQAKSISHVYHHTLEEKSTAFYAEPKYDGERMQIHFDIDGKQPIVIYSKSGRNSTEDRIRAHDIIYQSLGYTNGSTSKDYDPPESQDKSMMVKSCILEGELLVFNEEKSKIEPFGGVAQFRGRNRSVDISKRHLYIVFYDIIYINGINLLRSPVFDRKNCLDSCIREVFNHSHRCEYRIFEVPPMNTCNLDILEPLRDLFLDTIERGAEGLVIKPSNSHYRPGKRQSWLKMKPDYMRGLGDTGEYCIIAGLYDPKVTFLKITQQDDPYLLNVFVIGLLTNKEDVTLRDCKPEFVTLFTLESTGFSRDSLIAFCQRNIANRIPAQRIKTLDYDVITAKNFNIQYYFSNPIVIELKGSSYTKVDGNWTLRHPRILRERDHEVDWQDAISFQELQVLCFNRIWEKRVKIWMVSINFRLKNISKN